MRNPVAQHISGILIAQLLLATAPLMAQQQSREENRPRRVQPDWNASATSTNTEITKPTVPMPGPEPRIRVALATDARSAVISTTGHLMNAIGESTLVALTTARVRVEAHLLSPIPANLDPDIFQLTVGGSATREEAEQTAREVKKLTGEETQVTLDTETKNWGILIGTRYSRQEAEELRARLEDLGLDATVTSLSRNPISTPNSATVAAPPQPEPKIRLAASRPSFPSRELIASTANARLFSSSAPVSFASDNEASNPVRYNDRAYRGRIEVFTNLHGTLTVVNELGLEDYVRGVVANELSPGGYPALEALKAQAVAARTYALRNRGQFMAQGFDLLPTTRSQVYRGLTSENSLSSRAVDETRGMIATYNGEPINALYTSTCGGRTEDSENIFNDVVPYLRGRECAFEGKSGLTQFTIKTSREPADVHDDKNVTATRDVALLAVENFVSLRARVSDSWLTSSASVAEVRSWLSSVARLSHQLVPIVTEEVNRPGPFATALNTAVFGEGRASTLLDNADVDYYLAVRDATDVPAVNRADVALLLREGYLSVYPDATLRPQEPISRAKALHTIARLLESRNLLQTQKATARPAATDQLVLRPGKGKEQAYRISSDAFLFRQIGDGLYPVRSVVLMGGEPIVFHTNATGEVDYLEVRPAPNGASADRFSPFSNWAKEMSLGQVQARLGRAGSGIGPIVDLRVAARGSSRRAIDLEVIGTNGTAHVRGGRIRSILGLREQLFVIDRDYNNEGRLIGFDFIGRGWGHGVGMCQVGAYGLARQGLSYEQILKAYYTGIEVTRFY
ncbi:MAG TPA: SpoIID/LytB domain-containing protein [Pyrinomonadaceae bacterium]